MKKNAPIPPAKNIQYTPHTNYTQTNVNTHHITHTPHTHQKHTQTHKDTHMNNHISV